MDPAASLVDPPTSSAPTASVPELELESKDTAAAGRPPPHPHRAGQEQLWFESYSGLKRRTDVSARLCLRRGRAERGCSGCSGAGWRSPPRTPPCPEDVGGEEAPKVPEVTFVPRGIRASQRGPAAPQRERSRGVMSVRCDSLFLICLYFLSSCVVITFFFFIIISCSPYVKEAGSL